MGLVNFVSLHLHGWCPIVCLNPITIHFNCPKHFVSFPRLVLAVGISFLPSSAHIEIIYGVANLVPSDWMKNSQSKVTFFLDLLQTPYEGVSYERPSSFAWVIPQNKDEPVLSVF